MSRDSKDTSERKQTKTLEEVQYKCFLNDDEVPCRNMTFAVPSYCKPKAVVENVRASTMSCMLGTPARVNPVSERLEPKVKNEPEKPFED